MSEQEKKAKKLKRLPLFLNLITRFCSFMFLFLVLLLVFFVIGNNQGFLDENLVLILNFMAVTSISLFVFSLAGFFSGFYYIFTKKNIWYIIAVVAFLILVVFAIIMTSVSLSVNVLSEGF